MISIALENLKEIIPELEHYYKEFPEIFQNEMNNSVDHAARSFMKRFQTERLRGPFGEKVLSKGGRGSLFRRFQRRADLINMAIQIRTNSTAAKGLEDGANMSTSKEMPIPLSKNSFMFDSKHRLLKKYKALLANNKLTKVTSKGKDYLAYLRKSDPVLRPGNMLFILKHNIRVKKILGFQTTFDSHEDRIYSILKSTIEKVLINANNPNYVMKPFKTTSKTFNANA